MDIKNIEKKIILLTLKYSDELLDELMSGLRLEHFTHPTSIKAYKWMESKYLQDKPIGFSTALMALDLPLDYLEDVEYTFKSEFSGYLEELKRINQIKKINKAANELRDLTCEDKGLLDITEMRSKAQEIVYNATAEEGRSDGILKLDEALEEAFGRLVKARENDETPGLGTGYPSLDGKIGGLEEGHLTVLAAQTSMGKSAFAINIAYNVMREENKVMIFSLEMDGKDIANRLIVRDAGVNYDDFNRELEDYQWDNITSSLSRLEKGELYICEKRGLRSTDILARARKVDRRVNGLDLIIIDYLQMMQYPDDGRENTAQQVGEMVRQVRDMAGHLDVPIILISQLSRGVAGRPNMKHLRDSGMIEEIADEVWLLWRSEYMEEGKKQKVKERQKAELMLAKGRTKGPGRVDFIWYPKLQRFRDAFIEEEDGPLKTYK